MKFKELKNIKLEDLSIPIDPLREGELASEYSSRIIDYSAGKFAVTNRIIPPYNSTATHGDHCYDRLLDYIKNTYKDGNIIDMGCASGELLDHIQKNTNCDRDKLYGNTICIGEVKYARNTLGLSNVIPGDMRKCAEIFEEMEFNMILFHCVFQFIPDNERVDTMLNASKILDKNGKIIVIDYKDNPCVKLPLDILNQYFEISVVGDKSLNSMGTITEYTLKNG